MKNTLMLWQDIVKQVWIFFFLIYGDDLCGGKVYDLQFSGASPMHMLDQNYTIA